MKALSVALSLGFGFSTLAQESATRDASFAKSVQEMFPKLVDIRRDIHAHPELSNEEVRTAALVAARLKELGLEMKTGVTKYGVVALLKGGSDGPCVAVRADMDTLPIKELRSVPYRSQNPGVSQRNLLFAGGTIGGPGTGERGGWLTSG
jgi:hypothetical protein